MTEAQIARVREAAVAEGLDPDRIEQAVKDLLGETKPDKEGEEKDESVDEKATPSPTKAPEDKPLFQWHTPFVRVVELRARLGLTERIADDDLLCSEFLAKHGGLQPSVVAEAPTV